METLSILRHATLQIIRQPGDVLRIFGLPLAVTFLLVKLTGLAFTLSPFYVTIAINRGVMPWGRYLLVAAASFLVFVIMAAAWHRFILLGARQRGIWPRVPVSVYWPFLRTSLWIALLVLLLIFAASFVIGFIDGLVRAMTDRPPGVFALGLSIVLALPIYALALRLAVRLPDAAVGGGRSSSDIWGATDGYFWTLLLLLVALSGIRYLVAEVLQFMGLSPLTTLGFIATAVAESLQVILALSVVTTLYGHLVEKRPLA